MSACEQYNINRRHDGRCKPDETRVIPENEEKDELLDVEITTIKIADVDLVLERIE